MGERMAFGVRWHRMMRSSSGVVVAGLILSGTSVLAEAETVSVTPPGTFMRISVGDGYGCALTPAGVAGCWGESYTEGPDPAIRLGPYREISADWGGSCGLRDDY